MLILLCIAVQMNLIVTLCALWHFCTAFNNVRRLSMNGPSKIKILFLFCYFLLGAWGAFAFDTPEFYGTEVLKDASTLVTTSYAPPYEETSSPKDLLTNCQLFICKQELHSNKGYSYTQQSTELPHKLKKGIRIKALQTEYFVVAPFAISFSCLLQHTASTYTVFFQQRYKQTEFSTYNLRGPPCPSYI
jgi:hypothetical protein